jgi:hypothetical protein
MLLRTTENNMTEQIERCDEAPFYRRSAGKRTERKVG